MDFQPSPEQRMIQEMAREFVDREVVPQAKAWEEKGEIPRAVVDKMAELGMMGGPIPQEYGGAGMDYVSFMLLVEEIARGSSSLRTTISVQVSLAEATLLKFGSEQQKRKYLVPLARGERLGAWALTEPEAGSDAANQRSTAIPKGDHYLLNGYKRFISNGNIADYVIVFAREPGSHREKGISAFLVEKGTPGFTVPRVESNSKLGLRASPTADLAFEDCRIPKENLIGKPGQGWDIAMWVLNGGRLGVAAGGVGLAQAALDAAMKHAKERRTFDRPIGSFQLVREMIAEMALEIEAGRLLYLKAAWMRDQGLDNRLAVSMAKLYCAQMARRVAERAVQIHGGYGFIDEYPVERYYRDAVILGLYEGTNEIQKMIIAHEVLGPLGKEE